MAETLKRFAFSRAISPLLYLQSFTLVGFFTTHKLPYFIRRIGAEVNPRVIVSTDVTSILIAVCLFMTARAIKLRRRRAWIVAVALQTTLIATTLVRPAWALLRHSQSSGLLIQGIVASHVASQIIILILLIKFRSEFKTITDPFTRRQATLFFFRNSAYAFIFGMAIVYFDAKSFVRPITFGQAVEITGKGFLGLSSSVLFISTHAQERLEFFLGGLGLLLLIATLAKFFRPIARTTSLSQENSIKIRALLSSSEEQDSLGYFALRDNKTVIWSKNNKAAIPYSIVNGVMITTGDPVGDRESWPSAIFQFVQEAERHGWIPAVYGCSEIAGEIWVRETSYTALEIGDEAIVGVQEFTIQGPVMKNARQTLNRITRMGYSAQSAFVRDLDEGFRDNVAQKMQSWRKSETERGFSMALGRFCDMADPDCLITWCEKENEIVAVLQFVPWGKNSLSLDLMRRSPDADTGVNELMIQTTITFAKSLDFRYVSLNFASFRSIFERGKKLGAGPITRMNHKVLIFLSRFVQMESLYRFNSKFAPVWEPRFVIFPSIGNLVRVGYAIFKIEALIPQIPKFKK